MGKSRNFTRDQVLEAISGSGGIIVGIAKALRANWDTAKKYVNKWEETRNAFEAEMQVTLDKSESIIFGNIDHAYRKNLKGVASREAREDAKWLLRLKAKDRGYGEKIDVDANVTYTVIPAKPPEALPQPEGTDADR